MPQHECDLATSPPRCGVSESRSGGTLSVGIRSVFWEGWYVRQTDRPRITPDAIGEGLRSAFQLPASGAFQDLLEALDRVGTRQSAPGMKDKR